MFFLDKIVIKLWTQKKTTKKQGRAPYITIFFTDNLRDLRDNTGGYNIRKPIKGIKCFKTNISSF